MKCYFEVANRIPRGYLMNLKNIKVFECGYYMGKMCVFNYKPKNVLVLLKKFWILIPPGHSHLVTSE